MNRVQQRSMNRTLRLGLILAAGGVLLVTVLIWQPWDRVATERAAIMTNLPPPAAMARPYPLVSPDLAQRHLIVLHWILNDGTQWPEDGFPAPDQPFVFGMLGDDPYGEATAELEEQPVQGRAVAVERFARLEDVRGCQALFVSQSAAEPIEEIVATLREASQPVLIVVQTKEWLGERGGMIYLGVERVGGKAYVDVQVDEAAAAAAGLRFRPQLETTLGTLRTQRDGAR